MSDISRESFVRAINLQARVADKLEEGQPDDNPEFRLRLKQTASHIRGVLRDLCNFLDVDIPGVNVPNELCVDCGGEDGDHAEDCPTDKLNALDRKY